MNPHKLFQKVFLLLAFTLVVLQAAYLGADLQANDGKEALVDGILLAFWIFTFGLFSLMNRAEAKLDREMEQSRKDLDQAFGNFKRDMDKMLAEAEEERRNHEVIEAIIKDVVGKGKPNKKHVAKIVPAIYENTGLYAQVSVNKAGGFDVGLSKTPIETPAPVKKKAPAKKPVVKKATASKGGK